MRSIRPHSGYPTFGPNLGDADRSERLVFLHFEKAGGTTVHTILSRSVEPEKIFPDRSELVRYWPEDTLRKYRYFCLHASVRELSRIPVPYRVVTFLRDPADRIISLYRYWTSYRDDAIERYNLHLPRYAKSMSFEDFISEDSVRIIPRLWNNYTQSLAGDILFSPEGELWKSDSELVNAALANLRCFLFVGIMEDMPASLRQLAIVLNIEIPDVNHRENVTDDNHISNPDMFERPPEISLTARTRARLHEVTRLDRIVYDRCFMNHERAAAAMAASAA